LTKFAFKEQGVWLSLLPKKEKKKSYKSLWPVVRNKFKKWTERYILGVKAKMIKWEGETPLRRKQPLKSSLFW